MAEVKSTSKRWEDMEIDVLVKIFKELNMAEMCPVSQVCRSWRLACSDSWLWRTLDLGLLKSNFIQTRASPYIWVDDRSDRRLTRVLRTVMALSCGNVSCLIFHFNLYMKDEHLSFISERCRDLNRLVLPAWNRITKVGICQAIRRLQKLESLTMPWIAHPAYIMEEISRDCNNFSELKIMGSFDMNFATAIVANISKLKVLSVRCSMVTTEALFFILDVMENLEVLNISHCFLMVEGRSSSISKKFCKELQETIQQKSARLREFYWCQNADTCLTCQRMTSDEGQMRWWRYEESFWRIDEVNSLALGEPGKLFDRRCVGLAMRD